MWEGKLEAGPLPLPLPPAQLTHRTPLWSLNMGNHPLPQSVSHVGGGENMTPSQFPAQSLQAPTAPPTSLGWEPSAQLHCSEPYKAPLVSSLPLHSPPPGLGQCLSPAGPLSISPIHPQSGEPDEERSWI
jgi:hypothetical protein